MDEWQIWCAVALLFFIVEALTPGFLLACFGIGAMAGAAGAELGFRLAGQLACFAVTGLCLMFSLRPIVLRFLSKENLRSVSEALIGRELLLKEPLGAEGGRMDIDGLSWLLRPSSDEAIPAGAVIRVVSVGGSSLVVEPAGKKVKGGSR